MDLYIDKENLRSFIKAKDRDEYPDCLRMMRQQLHLVYNFDKNSLNDDPELSLWNIITSEGRGNSESTDDFRPKEDLFPKRNIMSNSYNDWNRKQLSSVYLIDDIDCYKLKDKGCVLIGEVGEEISVLKKLFCGADYNFHHIYDTQRDFDSWEQLAIDNQILPCTDIVILDRYIFKHQIELVECNLKSLLGTLVKDVKSHVNIVFFTLHDGISSFGIEKAKVIIKNAVHKKTDIKPNITFVVSDDTSNIKHDRFIITNYKLFRSGDSFVYFDTKGNKKTNGLFLDIDSLANQEVYNITESFLKILQNTVDKIKEINKDYIIGDKVSKFIRFVP